MWRFNSCINVKSLMILTIFVVIRVFITTVKQLKKLQEYGTALYLLLPKCSHYLLNKFSKPRHEESRLLDYKPPLNQIYAYTIQFLSIFLMNTTSLKSNRNEDYENEEFNCHYYCCGYCNCSCANCCCCCCINVYCCSYCYIDCLQRQQHQQQQQQQQQQKQHQEPQQRKQQLRFSQRQLFAQLWLMFNVLYHKNKKYNNKIVKNNNKRCKILLTNICIRPTKIKHLAKSTILIINCIHFHKIINLQEFKQLRIFILYINNKQNQHKCYNQKEYDNHTIFYSLQKQQQKQHKDKILQQMSYKQQTMSGSSRKRKKKQQQQQQQIQQNEEKHQKGKKFKTQSNQIWIYFEYLLACLCSCYCCTNFIKTITTTIGTTTTSTTAAKLHYKPTTTTANQYQELTIFMQQPYQYNHNTIHQHHQHQQHHRKSVKLNIVWLFIGLVWFKGPKVINCLQHNHQQQHQQQQQQHQQQQNQQQQQQNFAVDQTITTLNNHNQTKNIDNTNANNTHRNNTNNNQNQRSNEFFFKHQPRNKIDQLNYIGCKHVTTIKSYNKNNQNIYLRDKRMSKNTKKQHENFIRHPGSGK